MADDEFLTVPEIADRMRVRTMTVYRWIDSGKLPAVQIAKHYRVRASDLEEMLESARVGGEPPDPWGGEVPAVPSVSE